MRYLIIGLGIYGSNLAIDLTSMGHEVIGADVSSSLVESIKDYITTAYIIDSTDELSLSALPLKTVDLVIVAIGENFGASIKTVALLKKLGVEHIYARAIDPLHESILEGFNIDRILTPEQRAASDLVHEMALGAGVQSLRVDDTHYILKFPVPDYFIGMKYSAIDFPRTYGMHLIAVTRLARSKNVLAIERDHPRIIPLQEAEDSPVEAGDVITCLGTSRSYRDLTTRIQG